MDRQKVDHHEPHGLEIKKGISTQKMKEEKKKIEKEIASFLTEECLMRVESEGEADQTRKNEK